MKRKHLKLPNGFGQITKISNKKLRNPYRAMVTVGHDEFGKPISKLLKPRAYFETYNDAYMALIENHKHPYSELNDMTLGEVYEKWIEESAPRLKDKSVAGYKFSWGKIKYMEDVPIKEIKALTIKEMIKQIESDGMKRSTKTLLNNIFDFAVENEIVEKNYARIAIIKDINTAVKNEHVSMSDDEISVLVENSRETTVRKMLVSMYTGLRPTEVLEIKLENIHLEEGYLIAGMKTAAGTNRTIPIHPALRDLLEDTMKSSTEYLFSKRGKPYRYTQYHRMFTQACDKYQLTDHRPHDCRKTFITLAKRYGVDEYAIKRIVGHEIQDITEKIYTDRPLEWLQEEISKIPFASV